MKIIVTGCAGFIGSHTCRMLLNNGHFVVGIDNLSCGYKENMNDFISDSNFIFLESDIRDSKILNLSSLQTGDVIFHLAARGELYWCRDNKVQAIDNNIIGTLNILDLANKINCKNFIFSDTSAEYDTVPDLYCNPTEEYRSLQYQPLGIYSISKMCAAQYIRSLAKHYTILRYFNVYGPDTNLQRYIPIVISGFISKIIAHESPIIYGDGHQKRDFIYISDVVDLHKKIIEQVATNDTYNVGTGVNYSINDIYKAVSKELLGDSNNWINPIYKDRQEGEANHTLACISKACKCFEWKPKVSLENGIYLTAESIRKKLYDNS